MRTFRFFPLTLLASLLLVCAPSVAQSNDAAHRGLEIAKEADKRASGFVDSEESFTMTLRDSRDRERVRTLRVHTLERDDDGDWSMTMFDEPADVRGTALLTYSHGLEPDDQWIYLPAMRRVKRISSRNRSGPFMGSEFAFEDMSAFELEKFSYRYLRDEHCGDDLCFVVEWTPLYEHSGYTRLIVWTDQTEYRTHRIEYYDSRDQHLKTLSLSNFKLFKDRFWRALHWEMENHQNHKTTVLDYNSIEFGVGLSDRDFDQKALQRAR